MISKIRVTALKSIRDLSIECSNFNLFVGTNSSGKSTFLQALLLAAQKDLNGKYISLGEFREVRNYSMINSSIRIEIRQEAINPIAAPISIFFVLLGAYGAEGTFA